jgi:hypothetical protein
MVTLCYDIFRRGAAGDHIWVEAARDLESAKTRIIELAAEKPGQYVVLNQRNGRMVSSGTVVASPAARKPAQVCTEAAEVESDTLWK